MVYSPSTTAAPDTTTQEEEEPPSSSAPPAPPYITTTTTSWKTSDHSTHPTSLRHTSNITPHIQHHSVTHPTSLHHTSNITPSHIQHHSITHPLKDLLYILCSDPITHHIYIQQPVCSGSTSLTQRFFRTAESAAPQNTPSCSGRQTSLQEVQEEPVQDPHRVLPHVPLHEEQELQRASTMSWTPSKTRTWTTSKTRTWTTSKTRTWTTNKIKICCLYRV